MARQNGGDFLSSVILGAGAGPALAAGAAPLALLVACAAIAEPAQRGASALTGRLVQRTRDQFGRALGENHILLQWVHEARWEAAAIVAADLHRAAGGPSFSDDWLKQIHLRALEQADRSIARGRDGRDISRDGVLGPAARALSALRAKLPRAPDPGDPQSEIEAASALLKHLDDALALEPEHRSDPHAASPEAETARRALYAAGCEALIEDMFDGLKAVSKITAKPFIDRMADPDQGWAATYRAVLKSKLSDPEHGPEATRVLAAFTAQTLQSSVRVEALAEGLGARLESLEALQKDLFGKLDELQGDLDGLARFVRTDLTALIKRLQPELKLGRGFTSSADSQHFLALTYDQRGAALVGREAEFDALEAFLAGRAGGPKVQWWQIAGRAGDGKSRLAFEFVDYAKQLGWQAGFLRGDKLAKANWDDIPITRPTLIVIDYLSDSTKARGAARAISALQDRGPDLGPPIRFLLIERAPFAGGAGNAQWFGAFLGVGAGLALIDAVFRDEALILPDFSDEDLLKIARSWRERQGQRALSESEEASLLGLMTGRAVSGQGRDRARRPLFAMIFADLVAKHGADLSLVEAVRYTLIDERDSDWRKAGGDEPVKPSRSADNLAALAVMIGEVSGAELEDTLDHAERFYGLGEEQVWIDAAMINGRRGQGSPFTQTPLPGDASTGADLMARQPDLLAEYQIYFRLPHEFRGPADGPRTATKRLKHIIQDAWRLNPGAMEEFMFRFLEDCDDLDLRHHFNAIAAVAPPDGVDPPRAASDASPFIVACGAGWIWRVDRDLARDQSLATRPRTDGAFPLLMAAQEGHHRVVERLLNALPEDQRTAAVTQENEKSGTFPLLMAAQNGHDGVVERLLDALPEDQRAAAVTQENEKSGTFPLLQAAQQGHDGVVERLLNELPEDQRADAVTQEDKIDGPFPLLLAAENGHDGVVQRLLDALPEVQHAAAIRQENKKSGAFPLLQAAQNGHDGVVERLLGALPADQRADAITQEDQKRGAFPLLMAAVFGHVAVVRRLVEAGASPGQIWRTEAGDVNALDIAIANQQDSAFADRIEGLKAVAAHLRGLGVRPIHPGNAGEQDYDGPPPTEDGGAAQTD